MLCSVRNRCSSVIGCDTLSSYAVLASSTAGFSCRRPPSLLSCPRPRESSAITMDSRGRLFLRRSSSGVPFTEAAHDCFDLANRIDRDLQALFSSVLFLEHPVFPADCTAHGSSTRQFNCSARRLRIFLRVVQSVSESFSSRHGLGRSGLSNIAPDRKRDVTTNDRLLFTSLLAHNRLASRPPTALSLIVSHILGVLGTAVNFGMSKYVCRRAFNYGVFASFQFSIWLHSNLGFKHISPATTIVTIWYTLRPTFRCTHFKCYRQ